ncbi:MULTISPECIES: hypothetical protein [Bacillus]|jgi:hypothetical protein|uniref:Uncharacterized protein n=1 Tax=Bacillus pacificus TaxID=2026187 RepID=A0AAP5L539_9BACI|nr:MULTISPECIES: hypothetical protein [Bacillus]KMQ36501.1 hypothetical protein TU53_03540 [Bacillus cereus]KXY78707.1 hypothetical protein AT272_03450 [Bacillus cereus]MCU5159961.1 hypothetical protein [Bacillus pacificus]MCU9941649.1 hypothetical protein [Bacillus pacificus]MCX3299116.1 hypothetical protein [Bacillus pacificus]
MNNFTTLVCSTEEYHKTPDKCCCYITEKCSNQFEATNLAKMLKGKYSNFKDYSNLAILQHNNKQEYKVILISTKCNFHRLLGVMISK